MNKYALLVALLFTLPVLADTPPPGTVKAKTEDGLGTPITSTTNGPKQGLDVNIINTGGTTTVNQGSSNGGSDPWYIQGAVTQGSPPWAFSLPTNASTASNQVTQTAALNTINTTLGSPFQAGGSIGNSSFGATQSGSWSVGVNNFPSSFNVGNFPATQSVTQGTSPWVVSGTTSISGPVGVTQSTSPWVVSGTVSSAQSGAWTTGRTWSLLNTTDSVNVGNFPSTFGVTQSTSPWVISGTVTSNIGTTNGLALDATLSAPQGSVAGGSAGTKSELAGGQYNTSAPTLTNGQQAALQLDVNGNLKTSGSATISGPVAVTQSTSPWVVSGTVAATQSGTWTTARSWNLSSGADSVAAVQSGTWNINNISGTVSLPTLAATSTKQSDGSQKTQIVDGSGSVVGPNQTISGTNYLPVIQAASVTSGSPVVTKSVQIAGSDGTNARTLSTDASGNLNVNIVSGASRTSVALARNDYTSTNVTTAAYVQLIASTANTINQLYIFDSSGQTLVLATGGAGSEVNQAYIVPGGNGLLNLTIASGTRVSVKAISANATVGELNISFFK